MFLNGFLAALAGVYFGLVVLSAGFTISDYNRGGCPSLAGSGYCLLVSLLCALHIFGAAIA